MAGQFFWIDVLTSVVQLQLNISQKIDGRILKKQLTPLMMFNGREIFSPTFKIAMLLSKIQFSFGYLAQFSKKKCTYLYLTAK